MDAQPPTDLKAYADRLECLCRAQADEIAKLRGEVERLRAEGGAHAALKDVYLNPNSSEGNKVKAAAASLPFEQPKLMSEKAPLDLAAGEVIEPLAVVVERQRKRMDQMQGQDIEVLPNGQVLLLKPGSDGSGGDRDGE